MRIETKNAHTAQLYFAPFLFILTFNYKTLVLGREVDDGSEPPNLNPVEVGAVKFVSFFISVK